MTDAVFAFSFTRERVAAERSITCVVPSLNVSVNVPPVESTAVSVQRYSSLSGIWVTRIDASTTSGVGVGVGVASTAGVDVGVGSAAGVGVGVGSTAGVGVGVSSTTGVGVGVASAAGVGVGSVSGLGTGVPSPVAKATVPMLSTRTKASIRAITRFFIQLSVHLSADCKIIKLIYTVVLKTAYTA